MSKEFLDKLADDSFLRDAMKVPCDNQCRIPRWIIPEVKMDGLDWIKRVLDQVSNVIRRMGVNIIVEEEIRDLSIVYKISLPSSGRVSCSGEFRLTLASTMIDSGDRLAKLAVDLFADTLQKMGLDIQIEPDLTAPLYLWFSVFISKGGRNV